VENAVSLPPSTTTLRSVWKVAFSIFALSPHLVGSYYDSSQLADFINSKLGIAKVTEEIVKAALVRNGDKEYSIRLQCMGFLGYIGNDIISMY